MSTKIADRSVGSYLDALASKEPTPGGGAACALTAGQGAALLAMTVAVSGAERWDIAGVDGNQLMRRLHEARRRFVELAVQQGEPIEIGIKRHELGPPD